MSIDFAALGFTQEELQQRVVDQICDQFLEGNHNWDGMRTAIDKRIKEQVAISINKIAEEHVLPNVAQYVENLTLQQTNEWGEKKGAPVTFVEFLVQRAQAYMQEKVDYNGKDKNEAGSYSWSGTQTRITYLVNSHLHNSIETAMKDSLRIGIGEVAKGIHETARLKLNEIAAGMKVQVATR